MAGTGRNAGAVLPVRGNTNTIRSQARRIRRRLYKIVMLDSIKAAPTNTQTKRNEAVRIYN